VIRVLAAGVIAMIVAMPSTCSERKPPVSTHAPAV